MPFTLHPRLRTVVTFDDNDLAHKELVEPLPDNHYDPEYREAKRRRVEKIATQCLRGRPPMILSASLKGPFDNGWKNPWAKGQSKIAKKSSGKTTKQKSVTTRHMRSSLRDTSPEAPRAIYAEDNGEQMGEDNQNEALGTINMIDHGQHSGSTEFFSANTGRRSPHKSSESSPHWLRGQTGKKYSVMEPQVQYGDISSRYKRDGNMLPDRRDDLRLSVPNAPPGTRQSSPSKSATPNHLKSNAPTSMVISSPVRATNAICSPGKDDSTMRTKRSLRSAEEPEQIVCGKDRIPAQASAPMADTLLARVDSANEDRGAVCDNGNVQHTLRTGVQAIGTAEDGLTVDSSTGAILPSGVSETNHVIITDPLQPPKPILSPYPRKNIHSPAVADRQAHTTIPEGLGLARNVTELVTPQASTPSKSIRRPSKGEIQQAAERCAQRPPMSSKSKMKGQRASDKSSKEEQPQQIPHNLITSPTPSSSTGFMYRRVGESRSKESIIQKPRPRAINFDSSPAATKDMGTTSGEVRLNLPALAETEQQGGTSTYLNGTLSNRQVARPDIYDARGILLDEVECGRREKCDLRSSRSSRHSTQTAMALAQLEFQEGPIPPVVSKTPRPLPHLKQEMLQGNLQEPSSVVTPFHTFHAEIDRRPPPDSEVRSPLISTQDLFNTASPFAWGTVEKKRERPRASNLRFALVPNEERDERTDEANGKSPTPSAERPPLKEKNLKASFLGTASEKGSQESALDHPHLSKDVKLPPLDVQTSFDALGPDGDIEFTNQFLRNLDEII